MAETVNGQSEAEKAAAEAYAAKWRIDNPTAPALNSSEEKAAAEAYVAANPAA